MTAPLPTATGVLQAAFDAYAGPRVVAASVPRDQQIAALSAQLTAAQALLSQDTTQLTAAQQALARTQTDLAAALAADTTDRATAIALQRQVADLQAQLATLQPGKAPAPPAGWVEAFRDDMNGKLGPGWTVADNDSSNNELSLRLAANIVPAADHVSIVAKRQTVGTHQFTSGYLTTVGHASWSSFLALVRARCTDAYGLWPALSWFRFDHAVGELDGAEMVGTVRKVMQNAHQNNDGTQDHAGHEWPMPSGWSMADWHVYGLQRDPSGAVTWTIDGQVVFAIKPTDLSTQLHQPMSWLSPTAPEYSGSAHLIINLQVGGSMPNYYINGNSKTPIDPTKIQPGSLDIDYVQVSVPIAVNA